MRLALSFAVVCAALSSCAKHPAEATFTRPGAPEVVLHREHDVWRLSVDGADVTAKAGLKVNTSSPLGEQFINVATETPQAGLPTRFSLQWGPDGVFRCVECGPTPEAWTRSGPR